MPVLLLDFITCICQESVTGLNLLLKPEADSRINFQTEAYIPSNGDKRLIISVERAQVYLCAAS
jgi:hypothetical protein